MPATAGNTGVNGWRQILTSALRSGIRALTSWRNEEETMSDISFTCSGCGESLEADESLQGQEIACPSCRGKLSIPRSQQKVRIAAKARNHTGCPKCNSATISRCEMAYAQGTNTGTISGTAIGLEVGEGGVHPSFVGGGSVATQSQSLIAQYAAPPSAPSTRVFQCGLIGVAIGGMLGLGGCNYLMEQSSPDAAMFILAILGPVLAGAVIGVVVGAKLGPSDEEKEHDKQMVDWRKTWICLSCGHRWIPAEEKVTPRQEERASQALPQDHHTTSRPETGTIDEYEEWKRQHGYPSDQPRK